MRKANACRRREDGKGNKPDSALRVGRRQPHTLQGDAAGPRGMQWDPSGAGLRKSRTPEHQDMKWSKRKVGKMKRRKKKGNSPRQAVPKINVSLYFFFYVAAMGQSLPSCPAPCACTQPHLASRLKVPVTPSLHPASLTGLTVATQTLSCSISFHEADTSTFLLQDLRHGQRPKPPSPGGCATVSQPPPATSLPPKRCLQCFPSCQGWDPHREGADPIGKAQTPPARS